MKKQLMTTALSVTIATPAAFGAEAETRGLQDGYSNVTGATVYATFLVPLSPFIVTSLSFPTSKLVHEAKDDASYFIATEGAIKTVALEAAIEGIRKEVAELRSHSDFELAVIIVSAQAETK